jgi:hypothetical protein
LFADSEDDDIMPGPSKKSIGEKDDDMDRVSIDTATLEAEFQVFENKITNEKPQKIHEYGLPPPTSTCFWINPVTTSTTPPATHPATSPDA